MKNKDKYNLRDLVFMFYEEPIRFKRIEIYEGREYIETYFLDEKKSQLDNLMDWLESEEK